MKQKLVLKLFTMVLFYFLVCGITTKAKAQGLPVISVKAVKPVITEEMENDTTGTYRVGIPPKKVIQQMELTDTKKSELQSAGDKEKGKAVLKKEDIKKPE